MALNTNGWDYVYNTNLSKLNTLIATGAISTLVDTNITKGSDTADLVLKKFEVLNTSDYPNLYVRMTLKLTISSESYDNVFVKIIINVDWLNKSIVLPIPDSLTDINMDLIEPHTTLTGATLNSFKALFKNYLNEHNIGAITSPTDRKYNKYYNFFASLNKFKDELSWMEPGVQRFSVKRDVHQSKSDSNCIFSFSCMIKRNGVTIENKDVGYVDLNAIPKDATSALVIERSVFGEYMVVPKIATDVIVDYESKGKASFPKLGAYSFRNDKDCYLKYGDFNTALSYIGILPIPFIEWLPILTGGFVYHGTAFANTANISILEDHINLRIKDAKYMYSIENYPKVTQEYVTTFKFNKDSDPTKSTLKASVQLLDADINYFHTDFISELWYIFGGSLLRGGSADNGENSNTGRLYSYLPASQIFLKGQLELLLEETKEKVKFIKKKKEDIKNDKNLNESELSLQNERCDASENLSVNSQRKIEKTSKKPIVIVQDVQNALSIVRKPPKINDVIPKNPEGAAVKKNLGNYSRPGKSNVRNRLEKNNDEVFGIEDEHL